ncbi:PAS domain S-box protein [Chloroflexota bacterium]
MEKQISILIVDDDTGLTSNLQDILEAEGYRIVVANDGQTALALHDKSVFDLALVDFRLPDMSGVELINKSAGLSPTVEYVIITGYASLDSAIDAVSRKNIVGYLTKPLNMEYLTLLIRQVIERKQMEQNLSERNKELQCLYSIDMIGTRSELTLDEIYEEVVNLLPAAFQYPEITSARLTLRDKKFETKNYKDTDWKQSSVIKVNGVEAGEVQIVYLEEKPELDEGPFLEEERQLVNSVAEQLARITETKQAEEQIKHLTLSLRSIRNVNQLITREKNREKLLQEACRLLTEAGSYTNAWITLLDESGKLLTHAESGWGRDFLPLLEQLKLGKVPTCGQQALEQVSLVVTNESASTCTGCPLQCTPNSKVALTVRLEHSGKVYGLLSASMPGAFVTDEESSLFNEAAGDIAFALHDIGLEAKHKEMEVAILESEEKYRDLYSNAPTAYASVGPDGFIKESNKAAQQFFGYSGDELCAMPVFDLYAEESKSKAASVFEKRFKQGLDIVNEELVYQRKDGRKVYGLLSASVVKDKDGQIIASRSIVRDITEQKRAEDNLRTAEQNFRNSLDDSPLGIRIVTADGELLYANKATLDIYGYSSVEELRTTPTEERYTPQSYAEHQERAELRRLGKPVPSNYEISIVRKDGEIKYLSVARKEVIWSGETQFQSVYQDITDRKKAEETLRESEERWHSLVENAPNIIMLIDRDRKIQFINHVVAGLDVKDIIGRSIYDYIQPENHDIVREVVDRVFKTGEAGYYEIRGVGPDGRISWYETETGAIKKDGEVASIIQITSDITERKQVEEKTRQAAEEWRTTFDSITDLISIHDKDFKLVRVNKAFANSLNMKPEEVVGKTCYQVIHGANEPVSNCPHMKTLKTKKPATEEFFEPHLGIHLEVTTSPIFNDKGEVVASVHVARDVTERKNMQEQMMVTDRLASIGQLASGIAHEMNNPLTGVIGFSDLLLERDLPEDVKEDLETINREAKRTANVVKGLLTFARKQGTEKALVDLNSIIQEVLQLRAYEQRVSNIEVSASCASDLPQVMGNGGQLQQVFINLVVNAEQAMLEAHGKGTLTITTEQVGDIVRACVTDDGPGISPENMRKLFTPFFTTKEVGKGTGLGLSICHGIVTEHGGKIYTESELGKGTSFILKLPLPARGDESNEKS